jgi:hypothetical protein
MANVVDVDIITIESEEQAIRLLDEVLNDKRSIDLSKVRFGDWANLRIRLTGEQFHSSLTPTVMRGILELQKSIYQSYAIVKFGDENTRHLTDQERHDLEFTVKVSEGSALFDIDYQALIDTLLKESVGKMSPDHQFVLIVMVLIGVGGYKAWSHFINKRSEERLAEIEASSKTEAEKNQITAQLEAVKILGQQDLQRTEINAENQRQTFAVLSQAINKIPQARRIHEINTEAKTSLVRALAAAEPDTIEIQDVEMPVEAAREITITPRSRWQQARLDGVFQILHIDYSNRASLKIKIRRKSDDYELIAVLQDETMDRRHLSLIHDAAQKRRFVELTINASELNGEYKDATIISANEFTQTQNDES